MDAGGVQGFLNQRVRSCSAGYTCLKDYRQNTDNRPVDRYCDGYTGRANESAAQIIDNVARSCGISQQVLLVLLEKEQSLVTSTAPSAWAYSAATGQGCPDTAPCDAATSGFFYQVYYAARQYEIYRLSPASWGYQAGRWNNILYHPEASRNCGSARVYIENQATAGLYIYTPYTPNAAALNNLYGTGDGCSSYGNRNFWRLFTDWFGSTRSAGSPIGNLEILESLPGELRVAGWAIDPHTADPIEVHVYAGDVGTPFVADRDRPDVGSAYPSAGSRHGFDQRIPVSAPGATNVCAYAINVGPGGNKLLGCRTVTAYTGAPVGAIDQMTISSGSVAFSGWAIDPDTSGSIEVHAYADGAGVPLLADAERKDLAPHFPRHGTRHGFSAKLAVPVDAKTLCLYAINVGRGENTTLGCRSVMAPSATDAGRQPVGNLESLTVVGTTASIAGWAIDPDTAGPLKIHVYVGAAGREYSANRSRPDVGVAYPPYGPGHGFAERIDLPAGNSTVCVYAIDTAGGSNTNLGCRDVTAADQGRVPIGNFEAVVVSGSTATVAGWAIDPDTPRPIDVKISVNSATTLVTADVARTDVGAAHPGYGVDHGFSRKFDIPPGPSTVCVTAVNTAGADTNLGCKTVATRDEGREPIGSVDRITVVGTKATVQGWAIDPDTAQPIDVHIYAGGARTVISAAGHRTDVAAAFPHYGTNHGFDATVAIGAGSSNICVYAMNTAGANIVLGCSKVVGVTGPPFGSFDALSASNGALTATGWAIDPDTVDPIGVHIYVDGVRHESPAGLARPDVARAHPAYGVSHGYSATISASRGSHQVCVYAMDDTARHNSMLGCKTVTVP
ncbi:hypothetical protein [Microbacterium yannicii]|uniref:hypothetical protein n=1 Tax=Microbacterium yannicii TaxID=671622 RepID=UPI001ED9ABD6|nr:hypothetical protein [Microbacterium yannicii]